MSAASLPLPAESIPGLADWQLQAQLNTAEVELARKNQQILDLEIRFMAAIQTRRQLLNALGELALRVGITLDYALQGKTETRWTAKDGIATPGALVTQDALIRALQQARAAIAHADPNCLG